MQEYKFGRASRERLSTCHPDLQKIMNEVIKVSPVDFTIVSGYRNEEEQTKAFNKGHSKARFLESPHNFLPSLAVDVMPYVDGRLVDKDNSGYLDYYYLLFDTIMEVYQEMKDNGDIDIELEWAYDKWGWDLPHYQIVGWKSYKD